MPLDHEIKETTSQVKNLYSMKWRLSYLQTALKNHPITINMEDQKPIKRRDTQISEGVSISQKQIN